MRTHRTTVLILGLVIAVALATSLVSGRVVADNERRLLNLQADSIGSLLDSLASSEKAPMESAAVLAPQPDSDFDRIVDTSQGQLWARLARQGDGYVAIDVVGGKATDLSITKEKLDAAATHRMDDAFAGQFVVVGILGSGLDRKLALAAGQPGGTNVVAYSEYSLLGAAASSSSQSSGSSPLADIDLALYIGNERSDQNLVLATAPTAQLQDAPVVRHMDIGEMSVTYVLRARAALSGTLAERTPLLLGLLIFGLGLVVVIVIELNLRRRDHALHLVAELDGALAARDEADAQRAKVEADLRQAQRMEAVGQLAEGIAHDFNNILAAITSYADLLSDDVEDPALRSDLDQIRNASRRGAGLTRQLLQFSSRDPGQVEPCDLNLVVGEMQRLFSRTIGEEIILSTDLARALPPISMSITGLEQILMNLVVNARDAIDGPGTITIRTGMVDVAPSCAPDGSGATGEPGALTGGRYVQLVVTDSGCGMSPEDAARAFEPFFTTKERGRGTGLGLATVYGIVQRAGGRVHITSAKGEGATFEVLLPAMGAVAEGVPSAPRADWPMAHGELILLVEDEDPVRIAAKRMLHRWGYEVVEAANGVEALERAQEVHCDLLLTDVIMPGGLTGKDVADRMTAERPGLPVVFMSGYSAGVLERRGLGEAHDALVVAKPFREDQLRRALVEALASKESAHAVS